MPDKTIGMCTINNNTQTIGMCIVSATRANARSWRDKEKRADASALLYMVSHRSNGHNHSLSRFTDCFSCVSRSTRLLDIAMATQKFVDSQSSQHQQMNLKRLHTEVSNGTYTFTRQLTIVNCATQDKYIVYASCEHCLKGVQQQNNGYYCPVHKWQRVPVYRFALRVLLQDWIGTEIWVTLFNEIAAKALSFTANRYFPPLPRPPYPHNPRGQTLRVTMPVIISSLPTLLSKLLLP